MYLRHVSAVLAATLLSPAPAHSASPRHAQITTRVYHTADMPPVSRHVALQVAARTLAAAGVTVSWRECDAGCDDVPGRDELLVRLVRAIGRASRPDQLVLGDAYVDATLGGGVLATIYVDRVEQLAAASGTQVTTLLGRAIAHELGHLLLASSGHSARGLMRAKWSRNDLQRNRLIDWMFTEKDALAMRERLQ
jgi:hypothetical protein